MPLYNKLSVVVALIAIGLFASFGLDWPARQLSLYGLSFTLSGKMLLGLTLLGLTCTGTDAIVRSHPKIQSRQLCLSFLHWILPATLMATAWLLLARSDAIESKIITVIATSGLLALLISAEYYTVDLTGRWRAAVQFFLQLMTYLLALLLYSAIRTTISAGLAIASTVATVSAILSLRLLADAERLPQRIWLYVPGLGALLGILSWLLYLWISSPLLYSLTLAVLLYALAGIVRHFILGELTRWVALEYLLVSVVVLLLLFSYAR